MNEPIQDKAPKPPGLLPKHVQSWLILGLAVLMVVIMWLTSPKKPQTPAKSNTSVAQAPAPLQINETQLRNCKPGLRNCNARKSSRKTPRATDPAPRRRARQFTAEPGIRDDRQRS